MKTFEYLEIRKGSFYASINGINDLGGEGWELVSVVQDNSGRGDFIYFLKREVISTAVWTGSV